MNTSSNVPESDGEDTLAPFSGPWGQIRRRVEPLLGNLETHFEEINQWHIVLDQIFSSVDLRVSENLIHGRDALPSWIAIQPIVGVGQDPFEVETRYAPTFAEAVASLVDECRKRSLLPTSISLDASSEILDLWTGTQHMFRVSRMVFRPVSDLNRDRAEGTVIGVRKFDVPEEELLRRISRWPGLSRIVLNDSARLRIEGREGDRGAVFPAAERNHHPEPKEWLLSVRALCARCGHPEPDRNFLEAVAAAVFNVPTWNHLASRWKGRASSAMSGPWRISFSGESAGGEIEGGFYADGIDAMADLLARAPNEFVRDWPQVELAMSARRAQPSYGLQRGPVKKDSEGFPEPPAASLWVSQVDVMKDPEAETMAAVKAALERPSSTSLEALFAIGLTRQERFKKLDRWSGEEYIAAEGSWRFTLSDDGMLWARRFDGQELLCIEETGVAAYKAQLLSWRGHQVLCGDYHGDRPQAILDGLSQTTLARLVEILPDQAHVIRRIGSWPSYHEEPYGPYKDHEFAHLVQEFEGRAPRAR